MGPGARKRLLVCNALVRPAFLILKYMVEVTDLEPFGKGCLPLPGKRAIVPVGTGKMASRER